MNTVEVEAESLGLKAAATSAPVTETKIEVLETKIKREFVKEEEEEEQDGSVPSKTVSRTKRRKKT